jgi:hypothetical protein
MARRKKAVTGLTSELKAQLRLAEDPNLIVFIPVGGLGPVDIVTLNMTTGEYNAYDVKSKNYRKNESKIFLKMDIKERWQEHLYLEVQLKSKRNLT